MDAESEHVSAIHPVAYSVEAVIHNGGGGPTGGGQFLSTEGPVR